MSRREGLEQHEEHWRPVRLDHGPYSAVVQRLQAAVMIATEVETLRPVLAREAAYDVRVLDDAGEVRLRRRA